MKNKIITRRGGGGILLASILLGSFFYFGVNNVRGANTDIVINEIGAYEASGHEWIEIFNKGSNPVDLENWKFWEAETNHGLNLISGDDYIIEPGEYAIITQNDTNFLTDYPGVTGTILDSSWNTLNESGEEIGLKDSAGDFVEFFTYISATDFSLERKDANTADYTENNWVEHLDGNSVGRANYWSGGEDPDPDPDPENQAPTAVITAPATGKTDIEITLNGSNSNDADGTITEFEWQIDDEYIGGEETITYTFTTTGTFSIILIVTDDDNATSTDSLNILITDEEETEEPEPTPTSTLALIFINEFVSDAVSEENEWIELYNASTSSIDLNGYTLHDGNSQIYAPTSTLEAGDFVIITLSSNKLNNSGDIIILKNVDEETVDQVTYGTWEDGDASDNAPAVTDPNSVARIADGQDTNNDKNDFAETISPTPGASNIIVSPPDTTPPSSGGGGGGDTSPDPNPAVSYNAGDVVINELVSDPEDDEEEFVELFNNTANSIDLSGWWLEDGSESKTTLSGNINTKGFSVIEKPSGNLNNSGDIVILFDPTGKEIDQVTYGTWDDGNLNDNAPTPADPMSLIRKIDGQDANNDYYDFVLTTTITKGAENIATNTTEDGEIIEQALGSNDIIINEVLPNPAGSDNEEEFIEIKNIGNTTVDITGWKLGDSSTKRYKITQGSIKANEFIIFKRKVTNIALNNSGGDEVKLYSSGDALIDQIKYTGSAKEAESYARRDDNSWAWTIKLTPGSQNIIAGSSATPIINIDAQTEVIKDEPIIFDASDTTDPDGEEMTFVWDFDDTNSGEGSLIEHTFTSEGVYTVKLFVTDTSGNESKKSVIITVKNNLDFIGGLSNSAVEKIKISEFIPNPTGSDTTEFIELFNPTTEGIDISNLKLDDEEAGSRAYTIPEGTLILAGEYKVFGRQDTKLALNNTSDSVRILYPDGTILTEVRYDDIIEGSSYIQDEEENWVWTSSVTPGKANILSVPKATAGTKITKSSSKYVKPIINTTLAKVRDEDLGDMINVAGVVAVKPGVLGTQYFYIVSEPREASSTPNGVQIYSYKKEFPALAVGDKISVTGEISQTSGNTRIKTTQKSDLKKIDYLGEPKSTLVEVTDVNEPVEGALITVNGEITEIKTSYMYVDDGTDEIKVYFKRGAGIDKKIYAPGDIVSVTGIVEQTKDGYQILPRDQKDIIKTGVVEDVVVKMENETVESQKELAEKYLTATAGGLTAILFGLFVNSKGLTLLAWLKKLIRIKKE
ncbi:lamin tail domain-containing protein [Patescibacteria group bacterium]|nr:lamin tail domain-containing protein [Patescibacteria group bacterium]MBU1895593.1 lamin tail domain-containing protein [Patescibacteria group bacterium]